MVYSAEQVQVLPSVAFRYIRLSADDHVLTITLNRPQKKNALNPAMLAELAFALAYAHFTPSIWVIVLAADGDTFCAGMDLKSLSVGDDEVSVIPEPAGPVRLGELMAQLHKPCIAKVQGAVYAGGFLLVGGSTYVVAVDSVTFSLPEVKRGLFPFQVLAVLLDCMPARTALDVCIRAKTLSAVEAHAVGLVTSVVDKESVDSTVQSLVDELKQLSPTAIQFGLRAFRQIRSLPPDQHQAYLYEQFTQLQQTPGAKEGMAAFLEKRKPNWSDL